LTARPEKEQSGVGVAGLLGQQIRAVTARKPTGFSRGSKRVRSVEQPTDYNIADSLPLLKNINKE